MQKNKNIINQKKNVQLQFKCKPQKIFTCKKQQLKITKRNKKK